MKTDDAIRVRRAVQRLSEKDVGASVLITYGSGEVQQYEEKARRHADKLKIAVACTHQLERGGMQVERVVRNESNRGKSRYPELDALQVGQSHRYKGLVAVEVQRVRLAASMRQRVTPGLRLTCRMDGSDLVVSRLDANDEWGPPRVRNRQSQDAEALLALEHINILTFSGLERHARVRMAVRELGITRRWDLTTRTVGEVLQVIRLDNLPRHDADVG